ncbi:TlpA family protein disulfide reductase [candidate division KSB1 bacterium]
MIQIKKLLGRFYIGRSGIILSALVIVFLFYEKIYSDNLLSDDNYRVSIADGETVRQAVVDNRGKVVLLNLWATWCEPCVSEFPEMVALFNKYREKGLEVITVSFDFNDRIDEDVIPFLKEQNAGFRSFIQDENYGDQEFLEAVDKDINGVLPTTILYDRDGERRHIIQGRFDKDDLEKKILELLIFADSK